MKPFYANIENEALKNKNFRKVLYTSTNAQIVLMSLLPEEEIGFEVHDISDQFFRVEAGEGKVTIDGEKYVVKDGDAIVVPAGSKHNVMNTSKTEDLKFYTLYMPPHHKDGVVHRTKKDAEKDKADHL
ncbi:MAG: cupin domain-containing protein [Patescibacteria group bacterium]|nr:cupin domain-containing protein [Patescibacteria group bacterium]MDE1945679.1 cupin domain-containing protein [Patescibacteria group bacterium]